MARTILPSGEELLVTPEEILRYLNPDGLRQLLRQERLRWGLKTNRDTDYYHNTLLFKYSSEVHNEGLYSRMEIRTFPDNGAYAGYAGVNVDAGIIGLTHYLDKWDKSLTAESLEHVVNRVSIGAMASIPEKTGHGLNDDNEHVSETTNRMAAMVFDPWDGRAYLMSNDDADYVNNETRPTEERIPNRAVARVGDIPTRITQLMNDLDFISDPDYRHTDNNFTNSNRYVLDNIDDRTFVYPEISKNSSGNYIENRRVGLSGEAVYAESDGSRPYNTQEDLAENADMGTYSDRYGDAVSSYNKNKDYSGSVHGPGYLPGIFRSIEELERVDLVDQKMDPLVHRSLPGGKRPYNYYIHDGKWSPSWFDRFLYNDSYLAQSLNPSNMEVYLKDTEPVAYSQLDQEGTGPDKFDRSQLYQWRYNRVTLKYYSKNIKITIVEPGDGYRIGDKLRWTFGDDVFFFEVTQVGSNGQIQKGSYKSEKERIFEQDPSTNGVGLPFSNMTGSGHGAKLSVSCKATIETHATQIKNNLYAYVDITPTVRSDNSLPWSDVSLPDNQGGKVTVRSTAAGPAFSGINSGRGGPSPDPNSSGSVFYEHGGNATAGVHVHLFRYVINTQNPSWVIRDGIQVFLGKWVDQGPLGVERPCDIKALLFSNPDCNNFNNYYKFMLDSLLDVKNRNPDGVVTNNKNAVSELLIHKDQVDPAPDQRFYETKVDPDTSECKDIDITEKVIYINVATGVPFMYNSAYKNDPSFGYGMRPPGWFALAGSITK